MYECMKFLSLVKLSWIDYWFRVIPFCFTFFLVGPALLLQCFIPLTFYVSFDSLLVSMLWLDRSIILVVFIKGIVFDFCFLLSLSWKFFYIIIVYDFVMKKQWERWWVWRCKPTQGKGNDSSSYEGINLLLCSWVSVVLLGNSNPSDSRDIELVIQQELDLLWNCPC